LIRDLSVRKIGIVENDLQTVHTSYWGESEIQSQTYRVSRESREEIQEEAAELTTLEETWLKSTRTQNESKPSARLKALGYV